MVLQIHLFAGYLAICRENNLRCERMRLLALTETKIGVLQPEIGGIFRVSEYKSPNTGIIVRDLRYSPLTIPLFYIII